MVGAITLRGQSNTAYGELQGTITDPQSAAVSGATVILKRDVMGLTRQMTSGQIADYRFLLIPLGEYEVEIGKEGFQTN